MNWDPSLLATSDLALWQVVIAQVVYLPLSFLLCMILIFSGVASIEMTEATLKQEYETAGLIKRFFLSAFVGPILAIITQVLLCMFLVAAIASGGRTNERR